MPPAAAASTAPFLIPAATSSATAAPAISTLLARTRFIHAQRSPLDLLAVQLRHRILRIRIRRHRHKRKSARLPSELILHQQHLGHSAGLRKHILQLQFSRRERQIAYIQSISHIGSIFSAPEGFPSVADDTSLKLTPLTVPAEADLFLCYTWHAD
jgi:hypothetical protein